MYICFQQSLPAGYCKAQQLAALDLFAHFPAKFADANCCCCFGLPTQSKTNGSIEMKLQVCAREMYNLRLVKYATFCAYQQRTQTFISQKAASKLMLLVSCLLLLASVFNSKISVLSSKTSVLSSWANL